MSKLVLTADQIFALAYKLDAKYLDYYYISLSNRDDRNNLWLIDVTNELVAEGKLEEDFSGNTTIGPELEELIRPLYFGTKESSLDIDIFGEDEDNRGYRFHFLDDRITMAKKVEGGFEISDISSEDIRNIVSSILPSEYAAESEKAYIEYDESTVSRIFVVKNTEVNTKNTVATFVETDGVVYEEDTDNTIYSMSGGDFGEKHYKSLAEV